MNKNLLPACIVAIMFLSACQANGYQNDPTNSTAKPFTYPVAADANKSVFTNINKTTGTRTPQMFPSIPVQSGTGNSIGALNPAHGQPGHRCEIAVGAPLTSGVQQVQQSPPATQTFPVFSTTAANASGTTGLNPAHGQPGHRCDIAVGAPLNSPVKQVQPTASSTQSSPVQPIPVSNVKGTAGLNPAHGQPGHKCDIAVGASLNSPVKQVQPTASATPTSPPAAVVKDVQQAAPATQLFPTLSKPPINAAGTAKLNPAHGQPGHDLSLIHI